jgi:hypothetical protein
MGDMAETRGSRDRDSEGRARNARPRDGLGRPLPYGAGGVERAPEGVSRTPDETVREAQQLLDEGMPFHAHEVFEDAWKASPEGDERAVWRALAQLAVGITHAARGNASGARSLLRRAADGIRPYRFAPPHGLDLAGVELWADALADSLATRTDTPAAASLAPRLRPEGRTAYPER